MASSPLASLDAPITEVMRVRPKTREGLVRLGIVSVRDLFYHFPTRYENLSLVKQIAEAHPREAVVLYGTITDLQTGKTFRTGKPYAEGVLQDFSGRITVRWLHQPYLAKMLPVGSVVRVAGTIYERGHTRMLINPEVELTSLTPTELHESLFKGTQEGMLLAMYRETKWVSSRWIRAAIRSLLPRVTPDACADPIPEDIRHRYHLPTLQQALWWIHHPATEKHVAVARKRFAFEEVFLFQVGRLWFRTSWRGRGGIPVRVKREEVARFMHERFPFTPTAAQRRAIEDILNDFERPEPMLRLLEGDVGSGKTAVAAAAAYAVVTSPAPSNRYAPLQVAYMVPTELLARQQFQAFCTLFRHLPIRIGLLTSSGAHIFPSKVDPTRATRISRRQLLRWVETGSVAILVGTHALIEKDVRFANLAFVIIDEQHRFGVAHRQALARKDARAPHLLSMTATPIPRTLALTFYGDLDLSVLNELPPGRRLPTTHIVPAEKRHEAYAAIDAAVRAGFQAYIVCPRIEEDSSSNPMKNGVVSPRRSVGEVAREVGRLFPSWRTAVLHGRMAAKEKEAVMESFLARQIDVLITTTVVEVGVNVPNATVMVIEGAELFGLAQLHQLRGRVARSTNPATCYCIAERLAPTTRRRLRAFASAHDGFALAEADLALRGAGDLTGLRQSGVSDIGMEGLRNLRLVEAARAEARQLVEHDPTLAQHPHTAHAARRTLQQAHLE